MRKKSVIRCYTRWMRTSSNLAESIRFQAIWFYLKTHLWPSLYLYLGDPHTMCANATYKIQKYTHKQCARMPRTRYTNVNKYMFLFKKHLWTYIFVFRRWGCWVIQRKSQETGKIRTQVGFCRSTASRVGSDTGYPALTGYPADYRISGRLPDIRPDNRILQ